MKIKMITLAADADGILLPGRVVDVDNDKAKEFIDGGYAVVLEPMKKKIEVSTVESSEKEVVSYKKPKRRKSAR